MLSPLTPTPAFSDPPQDTDHCKAFCQADKLHEFTEMTQVKQSTISPLTGTENLGPLSCL